MTAAAQARQREAVVALEAAGRSEWSRGWQDWGYEQALGCKLRLTAYQTACFGLLLRLACVSVMLKLLACACYKGEAETEGMAGRGYKQQQEMPGLLSWQ